MLDFGIPTQFLAFARKDTFKTYFWHFENFFNREKRWTTRKLLLLVTWDSTWRQHVKKTCKKIKVFARNTWKRKNWHHILRGKRWAATKYFLNESWGTIVPFWKIRSEWLNRFPLKNLLTKESLKITSRDNLFSRTTAAHIGSEIPKKIQSPPKNYLPYS